MLRKSNKVLNISTCYEKIVNRIVSVNFIEYRDDEQLYIIFEIIYEANDVPKS